MRKQARNEGKKIKCLIPCFLGLICLVCFSVEVLDSLYIVFHLKCVHDKNRNLSSNFCFKFNIIFIKDFSQFDPRCKIL